MLNYLLICIFMLYKHTVTELHQPLFLLFCSHTIHKKFTNFTENVVKLFITGNCEMGCWDLGLFIFVDKNSEHIKSSTIQIVVPEPSRSWCLPLYLSPILPFCTMLLRLISVALSSYSMHHSSCFAGWGPTETDFSVHHHYGDVQQQSHTWIISGHNIQRHDIITSWSTHSFLHLSFFLLPKESLLYQGLAPPNSNMTRTKSRCQPLTQLWRAPTPFSA